MTLSLDEFLRGFSLHILPKGFLRIRNFGFLINRKRSTLLSLAFTDSLPDHSHKPNQALRAH